MEQQVALVRPSGTLPVGHNLDALTSPKSIAVVGASERASHFANLPFVNLQRFGYKGQIFPINPKYTEVMGHRCYPTLRDLPCVPDHVIIAVGRDLALQMLEVCVELGVPSVSIIASGFAETKDAEGMAAQARLIEILGNSGTRVIGPNLIGMANFNEGIVQIASGNIPECVVGGGAAIVSQSGGNSLAVLIRAASMGIGIGHLATVGNETDVALDELILYYLSRDDVKAVVCYIESIRNPEMLREVGRRSAETGKPIFVLKGGRTPEGQRAAVAHTGALATSNLMGEAAFRQWGFREVSNIEALVACAGLAGKYKAPIDGKVGVYGSGGGTTVLSTDMMSRNKVSIPAPSDETRRWLKERLPDTTPGNPFDSGGMFLTMAPGTLNEALTQFSADENFDVMAYVFGPVLSARAQVYRGGIIDAAKSAEAAGKPNFVLHWGAGQLIQESIDAFRNAGVLTLEPPDAAAEALGLWLRPSPTFGGADKPIDEARAKRTRDLIAGWKAAGRKLVDEFDTLSLLQDYGLPVPRFCKVNSVGDVDAAFASMGGTIAVKVLSEALPHRSEVGGVILGVKTAQEAREAFEQVCAAALKTVKPEQIDGVLFEEMLAPGLEMIAGLRRDPSLGMAVVFGFGGVLAEVIEDVTVRFPPFSTVEAKEMIGDLRGARLIGGYRNIEGTDPENVAAFLAALATLATDLPPEVVAIDLNPVILNRSGLRIADGLLELEG